MTNLKLKLDELAARKRAELEAALDARSVHDPFTIAGVVITWQAIAISAAVSIAASAASYALSRAFAPKPQKQTIGKLQGTLQLMNSEQGIMIPEIYGAGPSASVVAGASPTYQNLTNVTGGANGSLSKTSGANNTYNAGASHNTSVTAGQDAFIQVIPSVAWAGCGFYTTASPTGSGGDPGCLYGVQWGPDQSLWWVVNGQRAAFSIWAVGDVLRVELRSGRFRLFKNSAEFLPPSPASPSYPLYMGVTCYTTGAGVSNCKIKINAIGDTPNFAKGGIKVPAIIHWSSGIRKNVSVTEQQVGGKGFMGGQTQTTEHISYDIDLGTTFCRGPVSLLRLYANADVLLDQTDTSLLLTGVYDPTTGADADYDPELPPEPRDNYAIPFDRWNNALPYDGDGVGTGSMLGGSTGFAVYSGTATQDPDPTEEADIDAKHGTGSATAHRGKAGVVLSNFDLSKWGAIVPNITAAWENPTLATLDDIYASLCERVNVKAATSDYDFSGISTIQSRGMLIAGRLFSPAEVIGSPDIQTVYNYTVTEAEGQIIGWIEGSEPTVTIPDTEVGWMDSDGEVSDILPEVDTVLASEIGLSRQVDVKFIDLDKDWEPSTQSDNRQITEGVSTEVMEVQLALLAAEARTAAQRKLYRDYVAGSVHKFTLDWKYLYLYPGYKITITRAEGFNHVLKLTSISGGLGILECEGVAIEPAAFTQPATGSIAPGFPPSQPIPAMTILTLLDTPLLRDGDETNNNGVGFYACGTPRTGVDQAWTGFALYRNRNGVWGLIGSSNLPGTIGTIVSATSISTDTTVFDRVGVFVVDLYGIDAALSSITETDALMDATKNLGLFGDMVTQFVTATQVANFPNRWNISLLLNGRRGTEQNVTDSFTGKRFVLIDAAVKFVTAQVTDINNGMEYRGVSSGQSLADAATIEFAWVGTALRPLPPTNIRGTRNAANDLLVQWIRRSRIAQGLRDFSDVPLVEEQERYKLEWYLTTVLKATYYVSFRAAFTPFLLTRQDLDSGGGAATNIRYITQQVLDPQESYIEGTLDMTGSPAAIPNLSIYRGDFVAVESPTDDSIVWTGTQLINVFVDATNGLEVNELGGGTYTQGVAYTADSARVRITIIDGRFHVYLNPTGADDAPLYVGQTTDLLIENDLRGGFFMNEWTFPKIRNGQQPHFLYTADQQTLDGFTPGNLLKVRISQVSAIVGAGNYQEATI